MSADDPKETSAAIADCYENPLVRYLPDTMTLVAALASDANLDAAFVWLCKRRRDYPDHADVWDFRRRWPAERTHLQSDLMAGRFRFGLLDRITKADGEEIDLWSARDALVLKALAMVLAGRLPVSALAPT